jgi:hypothetical protein
VDSDDLIGGIRAGACCYIHTFTKLLVRLIPLSTEAAQTTPAQLASPACHSAGLPLPSVDPATDPELKRAWDITERLILEIRDEVIAHHANFLLVIIGSDIEAYPDLRIRVSFVTRCKALDLPYPAKRLENFARRNKFAVLSLTKPFRAYAHDHRSFLYGFGRGLDKGFGHWNADGHRLGGRLIAAKLCAMRRDRADIEEPNSAAAIRIPENENSLVACANAIDITTQYPALSCRILARSGDDWLFRSGAAQ